MNDDVGNFYIKTEDGKKIKLKPIPVRADIGLPEDLVEVLKYIETRLNKNSEKIQEFEDRIYG